MKRKIDKSNQVKPMGVAASQMLTLEPRILLDAAAIATGAEIVVDTSPTISDSSGLQLPDNMDTKPDAREAAKDGTQVSDEDKPENSNNQYEPAAIQNGDKKGVELVIVDKTIANYQSLIAGVTQEGESGSTQELAPNSDRMIEVIELDASQDGLLQITNALSQYDNISAVHILSHADSGELQLGNSVLNQDSLNEHASLFSSWQSHLNDGADILLYGCDVASTQSGIDFVSSLAELTGADVAASTDITGHSELGGDWDLEFQLGSIEVTNPLAVSILNSWEGALDTNIIKVVETAVEGQVTPGGEDGTNEVVYRIFIQNNDTDSLTNLVVQDLIHPDLVVDSTQTTLIETTDSFETVGNTLLQVNTDSGDFQDALSVKVVGSILTNDNAGFGGLVTLTGFQGVSANGGTVSVAANGSFTYVPPVGFTGVDSFVYNALDPSGQFAYNGVVEITVNDVVWYVDDNGSASGDGRSNNPFNSFTSINAPAGVGDLDNPGDVIYLHEGTYDASVYLENSQSLIGEGSELVVNSFLINEAGATPLLSSTSGSAIVAAMDNSLSGLVIGNTAGYGITASNAGNLTIDNTSVIGSGSILNINNGNVQAEFDVLESSDVTGTHGIDLTNLTSGSSLVADDTRILDTVGFKQGINIENNAANVLIDFGDTRLQGDFNRAFSMQGNSDTLKVSFDSLEIEVDGNGSAMYAAGANSSVVGGILNFNQAAKIQDGSVFISNIRGLYQDTINQFVFESISLQNNATANVVFEDLVDGVSITGTGTAGSGGVISQADSAGAIIVSNVASFSASHLDIQSTGVTRGIVATDTAVVNIDNSVFTSISKPIIISGDLGNTATSGITILNNVIAGIGILNGDDYAIDISQHSDSDTYVTISGNTIADPSGIGYNNGILYELDLSGSSASVNNATLFFDINTNTITQVDERAVIIVDRSGGGRIEGVIHDNPFLYGNKASAIIVGAEHNGPSTDILLTIQDNPDLRTNASINDQNVDFDLDFAGVINFHFSDASGEADVDVRIVNNGFTSTVDEVGIILDIDTLFFSLDHIYLVQDNIFNFTSFSPTTFSVADIGLGLADIELNYNNNTEPSSAMIAGDFVATTDLPDTPSFPTGYSFVPLLALNGENINGVASTLQIDDANGLLDAATSYWHNSSVSSDHLAALSGITLQITDLPDGVLGAHDGSTIYLDHNAANYGWFVDSTPYDAAEFADPMTQMDLLTVLMHEMGHVMGFDDIVYSPDNLNIMSSSLDVGVRYHPAQQTVVDQLTTDQVGDMLNAAIQRWVNAGISAEQVAILNSVTYDVVDLNATSLGAISGLHMTIDEDGAGEGWFVDTSPMDDVEFADVQSQYHLQAGQASEANGKYDLLTVLMHELGHMISLNDSLNQDITHGSLSVGERYLPSDLTVSVSGTEIASGHLQASIVLPELVSGGIAEIVFTTRIVDVVDAGDNNNGVNHELISNQAFLDADQLTQTLASNTVETQIDARPEFIFSKDDLNSAARPGETTFYFFTAENIGNQNAEMVTINDVLPEGTVFNSELSSPGWFQNGDTLSYSLTSLNVGESTPSLTLALDVSNQLPSQAGLINVATLNADQVLNADAPAIDRTATEFTQIVEGSGYLWMRDADDYYELGRDVPAQDYVLDYHGRLVSMDTQNVLDNIHGARHSDRYDPIFGVHNFVSERIETVKFSSAPAIHELLVSDVAKTFTGISPFSDNMPDAQVLTNQVNEHADQLTENNQNAGVPESNMDGMSEQKKNELNAEAGYQKFSHQLRAASNDFTARQDAFAKAVSSVK